MLYKYITPVTHLTNRYASPELMPAFTSASSAIIRRLHMSTAVDPATK